MSKRIKKYVLTDQVVYYRGKKLHRIRALRDIKRHGVKEKDYGGFVESESNLSHTGDCWIAERAMVFGNARVCDNALVYGDAVVCDNAKVYGDAFIGGVTTIMDNASVGGSANLHNTVCIVRDLLMIDCYLDAAWEPRPMHIIVRGNARATGTVEITDNVILEGKTVANRGKLFGNITLRGARIRKKKNGDLYYRALIFRFGGTERKKEYEKKNIIVFKAPPKVDTAIIPIAAATKQISKSLLDEVTAFKAVI